jgi:phospholipid/cholesterol/gamma-HCH transport system substrate-binding protein
VIAKRTIEIWVGLFVAGGVAALFMLAMKVSNLSSTTMGETYEVTAAFSDIGGLNIRSPVKASGVLVGRVSDIHYDGKTSLAIVTMSIEQRFGEFPIDTSASIYTAGLLGEQYVGLTAGGDDNMLKDGSNIEITDSAIVLERLIGQFLYKKAAGDE